MKTINFKFFGFIALFLCVLCDQTAFAGVIIIRKDDPSSSGGSNVVGGLRASTLKSSSFNTQSTIPVTADVINDEIGVFFSSPVGIATVSVVDQYGNVVEVTTIDTSSSSELYISTIGWDAGNYSLKISYGTTNLIGNFQL